jgi:hypothetical protein
MAGVTAIAAVGIGTNAAPTWRCPGPPDRRLWSARQSAVVHGVFHTRPGRGSRAWSGGVAGCGRFLVRTSVATATQNLTRLLAPSHGWSTRRRCPPVGCPNLSLPRSSHRSTSRSEVLRRSVGSAPAPSIRKWCFEPGQARSTVLGPLLGHASRRAHTSVSMTARDQFNFPAPCNSASNDSCSFCQTPARFTPPGAATPKHSVTTQFGEAS